MFDVFHCIYKDQRLGILCTDYDEHATLHGHIRDENTIELYYQETLGHNILNKNNKDVIALLGGVGGLEEAVRKLVP